MKTSKPNGKAKRRGKTFDAKLVARFDSIKEYPEEPDNRTLAKLLDKYEGVA